MGTAHGVACAHGDVTTSSERIRRDRVIVKALSSLLGGRLDGVYVEAEVSMVKVRCVDSAAVDIQVVWWWFTALQWHIP